MVLCASAESAIGRGFDPLLENIVFIVNETSIIIISFCFCFYSLAPPPLLLFCSSLLCQPSFFFFLEQNVERQTKRRNEFKYWIQSSPLLQLQR